MNWDRHGDALLQHYGIPSRALDVSYNAAVALWFAAHSFRKLTDGTATYVPGGEGQPVVYVFSSSGVEIEDLRKVASHPYDVSGESIPYYGLRGVLQKGGLLFAATKSEPDLRKYVGAEIRVARGIWKSITEDLHWCNYAGLFPSPDKDQFL
jgi:hypothetical protein